MNLNADEHAFLKTFVTQARTRTRFDRNLTPYEQARAVVLEGKGLLRRQKAGSLVYYALTETGHARANDVG